MVSDIDPRSIPREETQCIAQISHGQVQLAVSAVAVAYILS